jgi:hypothetical protein
MVLQDHIHHLWYRPPLHHLHQLSKDSHKHQPRWLGRDTLEKQSTCGCKHCLAPMSENLKALQWSSMTTLPTTTTTWTIVGYIDEGSYKKQSCPGPKATRRVKLPKAKLWKFKWSLMLRTNGRSTAWQSLYRLESSAYSFLHSHRVLGLSL